MFSTSSYNHTTPSSANFLEETIINQVLSKSWVGLLVGIIFFALLGNMLVILVFLIDKRLRMSTHYFMFSLAVSDVITAAFVMTFEVDQFLNGWRHSQALCQIWTTTYLFNVPVSILTACVSSIDRWYAITRPLKYRADIGGVKRKSLCAILVVWVYSVLFALIPKMGWNRGSMANDGCFFNIKAAYSILSSSLNYILPSFITAFFYYNMFALMKRQTKRRRKFMAGSKYSERNPSQNGSDRMNFMSNVNLSKSYALIGSLLMITWGPFTFLSIIHNVCIYLNTEVCSAALDINPNIWYSFMIFGYLKSAVNPVVYVLRFRSFRVAIQNWFLCRKRKLAFNNKGVDCGPIGIPKK